MSMLMITQQPIPLEIDDELWLALVEDQMDAMPEEIELYDAQEWQDYWLDDEWRRRGC